MSQETLEHLNNLTLIGFTSKRGNAWHYREELQGDEPNHYEDAIPVEDVQRRLFNFTVEDSPIYIPVAKGGYKLVADRKALVTSDTDEVLGVFKGGYQGHQYKDWLLDNVVTILDDNLAIGSAGLLRNRGQAWVSVEVPETITTPEGVEFRPNLTACTSFDGSLATTYKRHVGLVVCDNTLSGALGEQGQTYKLRHSRYSTLKIKDARDALKIVYSIADDFTAEVARLTSWNVSEKQFLDLLTVMVPLAKDAGKKATTLCEAKRDSIINLYRKDERVAPWNGNAFGVLQAYNTYQHHLAGVRKGAPRITRNMENILMGKSFKQDALVLDTLQKVCV